MFRSEDKDISVNLIYQGHFGDDAVFIRPIFLFWKSVLAVLELMHGYRIEKLRFYIRNKGILQSDHKSKECLVGYDIHQSFNVVMVTQSFMYTTNAEQLLIHQCSCPLPNELLDLTWIIYL